MQKRYAGFVCFLLSLSLEAAFAQKEVIDAIADTDYRHEFEPLQKQHHTRVLIDRYHKTIYTNEGFATGAHAMLEIMDRDRFSVDYAEEALSQDILAQADILIIHGLPNDKIALENGGVFWKSPLSDSEIDSIVKFVDSGGGLYLSLSHFPNGSGALPLLEAFSVKFRDGYLYSKEYPSFTDPENGRCSHYFGMSEDDNTLNVDHPLIRHGLPVRKVDYHCGAAIFRNPEDVVLQFPAGSENYNKDNTFSEASGYYAGMIGFEFGKGKVVVAADQGMFRNFIFTFDTNEKVYVTITSPDNDNASLFINMMRWLSPKISRESR
ncbi:hypothetical protein PUV54_07375 [Hyphococcus flavus]|uniref:DUF4350 domain-containing protein n=1 Tax=Hyphococcus flavus TaxID=1866326 RepID=A0AAE9ZE92_9PROT|nr:hypothetical protein [Hyphococcus flavus]WDI33016.1 hypothetical protein PUV54_07375 [Hyphococcus flavus]